MRRAGALVVACLSGLASLAGPSAAQTGKWRHAILEPKSDAGILMMAARHGFFQRLGLDVEIIEVKNETLSQRATVAGDLDSYEGTPPFAAVAGGSKLKTIGCYWTALPYLVFARENIATMRDMRGKSIAISSPGSAPDMVARALFEFYKVPTTDIRFANVGGDSDRYRAVVQGVVDATVVSGEYTPIAAANKLHAIATAKDALPEYDRLCTTLNERALTQKRADAVKFLAGSMQGLAYALAHRDETIALTREITGQKADDPRAAWIFDDVVAGKSVDPAFPLSIERIAAMQSALVKAGALTKTVDVASLVDLKLREEAMAVAR